MSSWRVNLWLPLAACLVAACSRVPETSEFSLQFSEVRVPAPPGSALPHLATLESVTVLSWVEPVAVGHRLRFVRWSGNAWSETVTVAEGPRWFVNWADFPAVEPIDAERLVAHWLVRSSGAPYAYDIVVSTSSDSGRSWREPQRPHRDATQTEHGFVTTAPSPAGATLVWLDGRRTAGTDSSHDHGASSATTGATMSLATAELDGSGTIMADSVIDTAVCDCCQTDAAVTDAGLVVVYRDRDPATERRDIAVIRHTDDGWSLPATLHSDGWIIRGCPVNGPAIDALGREVAAAWFTGADGAARVRLAFSSDAGEHFSAPVEIDSAAPLGRVDVVLLPDGSALVSWLARSEGETTLVVARARQNGTVEGPQPVALSSGARSAGFPQMTRAGDNLLVAWTDDAEPPRVRTFMAPLERSWLAPTPRR